MRRAGDPVMRRSKTGTLSKTEQLVQKRSKVDDAVRPYVWDDLLEKPGPDDASGEALARLILASVAGGSRKTGGPKRVTLAGSDKMLTRADIRRYLRHGIPEDEAHDDTLARLVWAWRIQRADREWAYQRWRQVVRKTELTDPGWKFRRRDFERGKRVVYLPTGVDLPGDEQ